MIRTKRFALLLAIGCGAAASAQTSIFRVLPEAPDSSQVIVAQVFATSLCEATLTTTITADVVRTDVQLYDCFAAPPPFINIIHETQFGPLAPGTYTYEVYSGDLGGPPPVLVDQEVIIVSPAHIAAIPTLGTFELTLLCIALSMVAVTVLRRGA